METITTKADELFEDTTQVSENTRSFAIDLNWNYLSQHYFDYNPKFQHITKYCLNIPVCLDLINLIITKIMNSNDVNTVYALDNVIKACNLNVKNEIFDI